jgi:UrcA family protein
MNAKGAYKWMPVLLAIVGAIGWTAGARAGDAAYDVPKQVVKYADLNLNSLEGASILYRRIEQAAERVCGGPLDMRELSAAVRLSSCKVHSIERAVDAVNSTVLTSVHLAKTGRTEKPITMAKIAQ